MSVAVSDAANIAPTAEFFLVETTLDKVSVDEGLSVSVSGHITDEDDDDASLQLVNVFAFDIDDVEIGLTGGELLNNQAFTFKATSAGTYDVTYVVYDHRTGYGIGITRIVVDDGPVATASWEDINLTKYDEEHYLAPWEKYGAENNMVFYSDLIPETIGGEVFEISLYTNEIADAMCFYRGMQLPTVELMSKLYDNGMFETPNYGNWPKATHYWTSSKNPDGEPIAFSLTDGTSFPVTEDTPLIATCVEPGSLEIVITENNATVVEKSTIDDPDNTVGWRPGFYNTIEAKIVRKNSDGTGVADAEISMDIIDDGGEFDKPNKPTSVDGTVLFNIRSHIAGDIRVSAKYLSEYVETTVNFVEKLVKDFQIYYQKEEEPFYDVIVPDNVVFKVGEVVDFTAVVSRDGEDGIENQVDEFASWQMLAPVGIVDLNEETGLLTALNEGGGTLGAYYSSDEEYSDFVSFEVVAGDKLFFANSIGCALDSEISSVDVSKGDTHVAYVCSKDYLDATTSVTDSNVTSDTTEFFEAIHTSGVVNITALESGYGKITSSKDDSNPRHYL